MTLILNHKNTSISVPITLTIYQNCTIFSHFQSTSSWSPTGWTAPPPSAFGAWTRTPWRPSITRLETTTTSPRTTWMRSTPLPRRPSPRSPHPGSGRNQDPNRRSRPAGPTGRSGQGRANVWAEPQPIRAARTRLGSAATEGTLGCRAESRSVSSEPIGDSLTVL